MITKIIKNYVWPNMLHNSFEAEPYFRILGFILLIAYPFFYFLNVNFATPDTYENFRLRLIIAAFGLVLILRNYWPQIFISYSPIIFYFILTLSFAFFFPFMLFMNHTSNVWQVNGIVGFVLLASFVDWISFTILSLIGVSTAYYCAVTMTSGNESYSNLVQIYCSYSAPILCLILSVSKRKKINQEKTSYNEKITILNNELEQKVEERTLKLERALAVKTDFLNNVSHEIRTPVQGFLGLSEGLIEKWPILSDDRKIELAEKISANAKRLYLLIGNLLDLAKFNEGKMFFEFRKFDLTESVEEIIREAELLYIKQKNIKIIFSSKTPYEIIADRERIFQVLRNIFCNAIKFIPDNGVLVAKLRNSEISYDTSEGVTSGVHFSLQDNGIGIPTNEIEEIFSAFTQSSKTKVNSGGTGLGLSISRTIIEGHHGKIWAENNLYKQGATFHFILPKMQEENVIGSKIIKEKDFSTKYSTDTKQLTILVIDDEESILDILELILLNENHVVIKAENGTKGLEQAKLHSDIIDLIFLDLMMPDKHGISVLEYAYREPGLY